MKQFALSTTPDEETYAHAAAYIERQQHPNGRPKEAITWDAILQEEPFEGQHWEGAYGLPSGATKEGWETQNVYDLSESDLSDFGDLEMPLKIRGEQKRDLGPLIYHAESESSDDDESENSDARVVVEEVKRLQYWRTSTATPEPVAGPVFDLGDPSSLGKYSYTPKLFWLISQAFWGHITASAIAATAQRALGANWEIDGQTVSFPD
jgi:gamma-tubulin complex component 5